MTGYQEILTDPSYMAQIVAFTFPHVGNVGTNVEDIEQMAGGAETAARGAIFRDAPTDQANWRADSDFDGWMKRRNMIGLAGVDTRALTRKIRETGMPHGVIAHSPEGKFDLEALVAKAKAWAGLDCKVTVVPAQTSAEHIMSLNPDGVFLSNGPGDPAATGKYAVPTIKALMETGKPIFGICLGHQLLGLAVGAETVKMHQGHHGANHPVKDLTTGKVEIVSMNHGFAVDTATLPAGVTETHVSLFDGSNAGLSIDGKPIFSVQYHPEASPGPHDSHYLFTRFVNQIRAQKGLALEPEHPTPQA
jgi:carbamoyl-phosphate synthase small subunit